MGKMNIIYHPVFLEHKVIGLHPENPERLSSIINTLHLNIEDESLLRKLGEENLRLVHTKEHIEKIKYIEDNLVRLDPDTHASKASYDTAVCAVGATILASQNNDFALVRPPGHHAYPDHPSGFCIFNNIAIATKKLVNEGKKVFIFDFDGHLGDGTMYIFRDSRDVLYTSIHQHPAFPIINDPHYEGEGDGLGYTILRPIPPGSGDDKFIEEFHNILSKAEKFNPDVVAVSAGFDGHREDYLLNLNLSYELYQKIGFKISSRFNNIFAVLEGGYNPEVNLECLKQFLNGINGKDIDLSK